MSAKYKTLYSGFKKKIMKGDIVELWHVQDGIATISNGLKVDYVLKNDLKRVEG